ncbi:putative quinol monooxygenase [Celeribacter sp. PS-C1]|uniref:putative quinol monooxygenase n=1 Tax=Celeribacter sp. PS-C1 TaxID=2820813 RepID=UPI001CA54B6B|nr:antibiotic biosynthesis monooxygenase [Celeribacter sp. PS-C1]MBW6417479.1 antibiotic biosynthesis monooxygenase [Celeribacter sp. PS-C1]
MAGKVMLSGTMTCAAHEIDHVLALLPEHIRLSRAEPGCLQFDLWQDEVRPTEFHVTEVFRDARAFAAHQDRTQSSDWWRVTHHMARDFRTSNV